MSSGRKPKPTRGGYVRPSFNAEWFARILKRAKKLKLTPAEYVKKLVIDDLEKNG